MAQVHRHSDARICGASTIVVGNQTVFVNGLLWAVEGDPNDHLVGNLIATNPRTVFVQGINVIIQGDHAVPDMLCPPLGEPHCDPIAVGHSPNVWAY